MDRVLGDQFGGSSWDAWRTVLASAFGLPLTDAQLALFKDVTYRETTPTEQASELWLLLGRRSGEGLPPGGCCMRTEFTKRERSPWAIISSLPLMNSPDFVFWPSAGSTAPKVKPPANAAPPLRNPLRSGRFEPMGPSFVDEVTGGGRLPAIGSMRQSRSWPRFFIAVCNC